jgi:hypothetical protein
LTINPVQSSKPIYNTVPAGVTHTVHFLILVNFFFNIVFIKGSQPDLYTDLTRVEKRLFSLVELSVILNGYSARGTGQGD